MTAAERIAQIVTAELAQPLPVAVPAVATALAERGGGSVVAVLFYGSVLRSHDLDGLLDFYVLVDSLTGWHGTFFAAAANRILPPNVFYFEYPHEGRLLRAKVAVLRVDQFLRRVQPASLDTTIWARFAQPVALAWTRDAAARGVAVDAVAQAVVSAAGWAARLGPDGGPPSAFWQALFRGTYGAELRVEDASRAHTLTAFAESRYAALLPLAWDALGIEHGRGDGAHLYVRIGTGPRRRAARGWALRRALGKPLNLLRLIKSAYTFADGVDYLLWKVERHSGVKLELSAWQRRHPILAAPAVLWQLRRLGALR